MYDENKIEVLEERVTNWMESTTEYRKELCRKIDNILQRLSDLPCKERKAWYESMEKQVTYMWIVITVIILPIVWKLLFANGK